jgi:drug/metabolite transporter (DMT)-like permease
VVLLLSLLIRKTWVVFVYAIAIASESIIIEYLTTSLLQFSPIVLASISITLAGTVLLLVAAFVYKKEKELSVLFSKSWKHLILASVSLSSGIFTWYDSISRIGASKELLIAGPLEIVIIVFFARLFLSERLNRFHTIGIIMALAGFLMAVASDANIHRADSVAGTLPITAMPTIMTFGDIEAILSAFGFAIGVLFLSKLVLEYSSISVAGGTMFSSGLILVSIMLLGLLFYDFDHTILASNEFSLPRQPLLVSVTTLFLFSLISFVGSLSYSAGLSKIGPSITATVGSSSILITILVQIVLKEFGIAGHLPENLLLAILGGITGFLGICIIHIPDYSLSAAKEE